MLKVVAACWLGLVALTVLGLAIVLWSFTLVLVAVCVIGLIATGLDNLTSWAYWTLWGREEARRREEVRQRDWDAMVQQHRDFIRRTITDRDL